ncbi:hypothetical protein DAI22_02g149601 [Oryza sativa Japonica Group]|nr:hypothetical protein DAI22_02g149601 [Oryza sativa Japonica Group]
MTTPHKSPPPPPPPRSSPPRQLRPQNRPRLLAPPRRCLLAPPRRPANPRASSLLLHTHESPPSPRSVRILPPPRDGATRSSPSAATPAAHAGD